MSRLKPALVEELIKQGRLYKVGGAVRDALLPEVPPSKDIDFLVTGIPYKKLCTILNNYGRVDSVGRSFGVIKFTQPANGTGPAVTYDFVLPRTEHSTGEGHKDFAVIFDHQLPVEDDLKRRDFTINAIAHDFINGEFIDPLAGREDIVKRLIRYTSEKSFTEDPLRMLRAIQFAARFNFKIEDKTYQAICENAKLIKTVSPERIAEELNKLLTRSEKPSIGFLLMQKTGLLLEVMPELEAGVGVDQPGPYHKYPVFEHSLYACDNVPPRLALRMAALLHDIAKPDTKRAKDDGGASFYGHESVGARRVRKILRRLRYSNDFIDDVSRLVERHMFTTEVTDKGLRRLIRKVTPELIFDLLDLRRADVIAQGMGGTTEDVDEMEQRIKDEIAKKPPFGFADLKVNGRDLIKEFDLSEGELIGKVLDHLLENVLDYPEKNEYDILIKIAKVYLKTRLEES